MDFSSDLFLEYKKRPGRASLARLLERHQVAVYTLCRQVLHHPQDAEDACQEILLEVSRQVASIDEPEKFSGWLYRTALHTALDLKRQRGRRKLREAGVRAPAAGPTPETTEALHQGLAGLDDTSRTLVVEHYFGRRPLRELAAERGCSEVAVWKRIESARERLKKVLGSATVAALDGVATVPAPAGMVPKALGIAGGLAMKVGVKVAIVAPLLLLAGAGAVLTVRHPDPAPPPSVEVRKPAARPSAKPTAPSPATPTVAAAAPIRAKAIPAQPAARIRKPYPFTDHSADWPPAAVRTWSILSSKKITLDHSNISLADLLKDLSELTGISIAHAPGFDQEIISIKVAEIVADGCLRLLLQPRNKNFEILADGSLRVGESDAIRGGYEKVGREVTDVPLMLNQIRRELEGGWDGVGYPDHAAALETMLRSTTVLSTQGDTTLEAEFERLRTLGVGAHLEYPSSDREGLLQHQAMMRMPFIQVVGERSLDAHLQELARTLGLVAVPTEGSVIFTTERNAPQYVQANAEARRTREQFLEAFRKPVEASESSDVTDFLESVRRTHALEFITSEETWNSGATLSLPAGTTLRKALDQLKAQGFRWAVRDGKLYVLK